MSSLDRKKKLEIPMIFTPLYFCCQKWPPILKWAQQFWDLSLLSLSLDKNILNSCLNKIGRTIFQLVVYMWTLLWKFSGSPVVGTPRFHYWNVQCLVWELRSHKPFCAAKKPKTNQQISHSPTLFVSITLMRFFIVQK